MRNQSLQSSIDTVMSTVSPTLCVVSLEMISSTNPSFNYSPLLIKEMRVTQTFNSVHPEDSNYADVIRLSFDIATSDYANVYDQRQDLMAILTIKYCDNNGIIAQKVPPYKMTYRVMIENARDVRKEMIDAHLRTTPDTQMTVQLLEDTIYKIRLSPFNAIYRAAKMSDVIRHTANVFGITSLEMVPPDSDSNTFDQVVVKPYKDFSNVFDYYQHHYGIYMCGVSHYYTSGMLHVYAPYDTAVKTQNTVSIYQADQGMYAGANSFHAMTQTGDLLIVANEMSKMSDLSIAATENKGSSKMFLRAANVIDGILTSDDRGNLSYDTSSAVAIRLNTKAGLATATVNNQYEKTTDNMYAVASDLVSHQAIIAHSVWPHAIPFSVSPGQSVTYYSDEHGLVRKRTGIMEAIDYALQKHTRTSAGSVMVCKAHVTTRLDPVGTLQQSVTG